MSIDAITAIIFILLLALFLWKKRRNVELQRMLFPILYVVMYRSKFGIAKMDSWAKSFPRFLKWLGYAGVVLGFLGMIVISFELVKNSFDVFLKPEAAPGIQPVLPFEAKGVFFVPFLYWIISIFLLAVVHEFAHGVIARVHNVHVKSSGFAFLCFFLPVIPAAFVEPEETILQKRRYREQLSVFAAGPISNLLFALLMLLLFTALSPAITAAFEPKGVEIASINETGPAGIAGLVKGDIITMFGEQKIESMQNVSAFLATVSPGTNVMIQALNKSVMVTLGQNPTNASLAFLGIKAKPYIEKRPEFVSKYGGWLADLIKWFAGLLFWLFTLNIGIGLFNLLPIGPLDGGRMFQLALLKVFRKETAQKVLVFVSFLFVALIISNMLFGFFR